MNQVTKSPKTIFAEAIEIHSPEDRRVFLDRACEGHPELRQTVEKLVGYHFRAGSFLESPAVGVAGSSDGRGLTEDTGTVIGPYKLLQQIGEGGMGVVFMAEQKEPIQRTVALKIIKPGMDTRQVIARFEVERQALAMMDHPNIAKVLDAGTTETGRPYFVMDLVKGIPITDYCDQHHLTIRQRLGLFTQVCHAVQHAHQKGIIHRDLKPTNILVAEYDNRAVPRIIDFGVAKATAQKLTKFTEFGQLIGTFEYMSPEQARFNQLDVDTRSDIYSLGVLLYELLTGSTPLENQRVRGAAFDEILRIIGEEDPPTPSTRLSGSQSLPSIAANRSSVPIQLTGLVSGELDWIAMKCLEKNREQRYDTASELGADIERYLNDETIVARPATRLYRLRKYIRRNRIAVAAVVSITVAVAAGLLLASFGFIRAREQAAIARQEAVRSEQVAKFLKQIVSTAAPSVARGRDATLFRAVLERAVARVETDLHGQPEVQGDLWFIIGSTFKEIGAWDLAIGAFQHAADHYRVAPGGDNPKLARSLSCLGANQAFIGRVADGNANSRLGLAMARSCDDLDTLSECLRLMGKSYAEYGMAGPESEPYFREAVAIQRSLGKDPAALAKCLLTLATSTNMSYEEAVLHVREAIEIQRANLGPYHPDLAGSLDVLQQLLGGPDPAGAEVALKEELDIYRKIYDPSAPYFRTARRGLAAVLVTQGKWDEAEAMARAAGDPTTPDGTDWDLVGRINAFHGRWEKAALALARALQSNPKMDKYRLAVALAATDQEAPYRELRIAFIEKFQPSGADDARMLAFLLRPIDDDASRIKLKSVAPRLDYSALGPLMASRGRLDRALALYRLGDFEKALEAATPTSVEGGRPANQAQAWVIQALVASRRGQADVAHAALEHADELLKSNERYHNSDYLEDSFDWQIAEILRAEANDRPGNPSTNLPKTISSSIP